MYIQNLQPIQVNGNSYLNVMAYKVEQLTIKVLDAHGMMAKKISAWVQEGEQQLNLNLSDLSTGNYIMNAFSGDHFIKSIRFIKQ
jgi:hypothetical protein